MKRKTTRQLSDEHEEYIVSRFAKWNARRSPSSGAVFSDPVDVISDAHVIECKATESGSISVKLSDWLKNRDKSYNGRQPMMAFRFKDPHTGKALDLILQEIDEVVD